MSRTFLRHLSAFPFYINHKTTNLNYLKMYYHYKPQLKIKDGAATADYKPLIQRALATPVPSPESQDGPNTLLPSTPS